MKRRRPSLGPLFDAYFGRCEDLKHPTGRLQWVDLGDAPWDDLKDASRGLRETGRKVTLAIMNPVPLAEVLCAVGSDEFRFDDKPVQADANCPPHRVYFFTVDGGAK